MINFDIQPFLHRDDPWLSFVGLPRLRQIYGDLYDDFKGAEVRSIVEIGTRGGYSAAALLSACPNATYIGFDEDFTRFGGWAGSAARAKDMLEKHFPGKISIKKLDTQSINTLPCGPVDLAVIDADQSESGLRHDLHLVSKIAYNVHIMSTPAAHQNIFGLSHIKNVSMTLEPDLWWSSSGDFGDTIGQLATIRHHGGGRLALPCRPWYARDPYSQSRFNTIRPLLAAQQYIKDVVNHEVDRGIDLDIARRLAVPGLHHLDNCAKTFDVPHPVVEPWLWVEPKQVAEVVFNRTVRYNNSDSLWMKAKKKYPDAVFLGDKAEHTIFESKFGPIRWVPTKDLLEAARIIEGSLLFVGCQSALHMIALGLGTKTVAELDPRCPVAHSKAINCLDPNALDIVLPEVYS